MKPTERIEQSIKNLRRTTTPETDQCILNDAFAALEESTQAKPPHDRVSILGMIIKAKTTKLAVVVVVIAAALISVRFLTHAPKSQIRPDIKQKEVVGEQAEIEPKKEIKPTMDLELDLELEQAVHMFASRDVNGLVDILSRGRLPGKLAATYYLGQIGNLRAVEPLKKLSAEYGGNDPNNPFALAAKQIQQRLAEEKREAIHAKGTSDRLEGPPAKKDAVTKTEKVIIYIGLVADANGEPVPEVSVRSNLYYRQQVELKRFEKEVFTDSNGLFEIAALPVIDQAKEHRIIVFNHPDYAIGWLDTDRSGFIPTKIVLSEPGSIAGTVADEQGNPIEGAKVLANPKEEQRYSGMGPDCYIAALTDSEGRFLIEKIFEGARLHVDVSKEGYLAYSTRAFGRNAYPVRVGEDNLVITLRRGGVIKGRLTVGGKPYFKKGVVVKSQGVDNDSWGITDENGQFKIIGLDDGKYTLTVRNEELVDAGLICKPKENVEVRVGMDSNVKLPLQKGIPVTLLVVDKKTRNRVRHHQVWIGKNRNIHIATSISDADGQCVVHLVHGEYLAATNSWFDGTFQRITQDFSVKPESKELNIELAITPRPKIYGWLVDAEGEPVRGVVSFGGLQEYTNDQGEFEVAEPKDRNGDTYVCYAFDRERKLGRGFFWQRSDDTNDFEVILEPLASIMGRIVDEKGQVMPGAKPRIAITDPNGRWRSIQPKWWKITAGDDGRFTIEQIPTGLPMVVYTNKQPDADAVEIGLLKPGEVRNVEDIVWKTPIESEENEIIWDCILTGYVTDEDGEVLIGVQMSVETWQKSFIDYTDTNGQYKLVGLPKGKLVQLIALKNDYSEQFDVVCDGNDFNVQLFPTVSK